MTGNVIQARNIFVETNKIFPWLYTQNICGRNICENLCFDDNNIDLDNNQGDASCAKLTCGL